ncbi:uncharacterized protein THITE_2094410 [Thermothielavioides terrestris NRRL 8126]|uniref:F-box domain-containing protein n=1 Tax=Thermothielavioides terrestris (strain ATCC 38088 / NRRL 8126) TaxID=578455 RepID=G2QRC6_THETT|nr:uncharacterized protein THITE_2094410 [Thermothielavioides terrestris NRRL 8126]AEO64178.1 hypothetical protein THITE_2094410 [Thermothielavioides terrestris NRRL 8126]
MRQMATSFASLAMSPTPPPPQPPKPPSSRSSSLQTLPTEMLLHILGSVDSLSDLRALGSTCRRIHAIFEEDKASLIYGFLRRQLGPVLPDALALYEFDRLDASSPRYHEDGRAALALYDAYLRGNGLPRPRQVPLGVVLHLLHWHRVMADLTDVYVRHASAVFHGELDAATQQQQQPLPDPATTRRLLLAPPAQHTERHRILRAFYRLQILYDVNGAPTTASHRAGPDATSTTGPNLVSLRLALLGFFWPWEHQQLASVGFFMLRLNRMWTAALCGSGRSRGQHLHPDPRRDRALRRELRRGLLRFPRSHRQQLRDWLRSGRARNLGAYVHVLKGFRAALPRWWEDVVVRKTARLVDEPGDNDDDGNGGGGDGGNETQGGGENWSLLGRDHVQARMDSFPPGSLPFSAHLRFEGDRGAEGVSCAWADAFEGGFVEDTMLFEPSTEVDGMLLEEVWFRVGFVFWDEPRYAALKALPRFQVFKTGWAARKNRGEEESEGGDETRQNKQHGTWTLRHCLCVQGVSDAAAAAAAILANIIAFFANGNQRFGTIYAASDVRRIGGNNLHRPQPTPIASRRLRPRGRDDPIAPGAACRGGHSQTSGRRSQP